MFAASQRWDSSYERVTADAVMQSPLQRKRISLVNPPGDAIVSGSQLVGCRL